MDFDFPLLAVVSVGLCALLLVGCGGGDSPSDSDWTIEEGGLTLERDLLVSEGESFYFGTILDVAPAEDGRIYVADADAGYVKVLSQDGRLVDTLGREGEGPGEFQQLRSVQVARGDSIYAYDPRRSRLTVFAPPPSLTLARTLTISREEGFAGQVHVLEDRLLGAFGSGVSPKDGVRRPAPDPWRWINASGTPGDTVMMARQRKRALKSTNGRIRIRPIPFARKTQTAVGPQSRLYYGWTDSLRIAAQAPDGTSEAVASVPTEPIPVQEAERDSALTHLDGDMKGMLASALPDTKPAFTDLIVADTGRLWVERPPKKPGTETVPWWVLNPEPKTIHEVQVPSEVDLEVVLNGTAYGTTETEMGAPAVVRYRLNSSS